MSGGGREELRRLCRRRRRSALPGAAAAILAAAQRELPALLPAGRRLGLYWPLGSEADLRPLAALWPERLALPAVRDQLEYLPWRPGETLEPDACGIPAPAGAPPLAPAELGLLLVPALAVDRRGLRLGSGGGWYDRLRADPAWRAVPALAVLPAACVLEALPAEAWDVPFDGWLDDQGLHRVANVATS